MTEKEDAFYTFDAMTEEFHFKDTIPKDLQMIAKNIIQKHLNRANEELEQIFQGIKLE